MEECFGLTLPDLLLGKDSDLSANDHQKFQNIASRLLAGEPVQHILGFADFCGHRFCVTPDVLIPRPETEGLVTLATAVLSGRDENGVFSPRILDLGTGSGCIALSLALAHPEATVVAVDVSAEALAVACRNAELLGVRHATMRQGDILHWTGSADERYDLIVSNPPYIRPSEALEMEDVVLRHEPHQALFVPEDDPLIFYRKIVEISRRALSPSGAVVVEINSAFPEATAALFRAAQFGQVTLHGDLFGQPRFVCAIR